MEKAVLIPIHPEWCELIISGKKTVEVRKTMPKLDTPFKCYMYCTKSPFELVREKNGNITLLSRNKKADITDLEMLSGKVIGEFVCDKIFEVDYGIEEGVCFDGEYQKGFEVNGKGDNPTCLSFADLENYLTNNEGYGWHISDLKIYDKPKELNEFYSLSYQKKCGYCVYLCESYPHCVLKQNRKPMTRPPQSWCYVEALHGT